MATIKVVYTDGRTAKFETDINAMFAKWHGGLDSSFASFALSHVLAELQKIDPSATAADIAGYSTISPSKSES